MKNDIQDQDKNHPSNAFNNILEETLREGARKLLQQTIEAEVDDYLEMYKHIREEDDKQSVIRNGHLPKRAIQTT